MRKQVLLHLASQRYLVFSWSKSGTVVKWLVKIASGSKTIIFKVTERNCWAFHRWNPLRKSESIFVYTVRTLYFIKINVCTLIQSIKTTKKFFAVTLDISLPETDPSRTAEGRLTLSHCWFSQAVDKYFVIQ